MESHRMKNIVILILILLNLFLLLLVASKQYARHRAEQNLIGQTVALLQSNGIEIDESLLQGTAEPVPYAYSRSPEDELLFASALLGEITTQHSINSGNTHLYANASGSATFRPNGSFTLDIAQPTLYAEDYQAFLRDDCPANYRITQITSDGARDTVIATPYMDDLPVYSAAIAFTFEDHLLTAASGYFISSAAAPIAIEDTITKCSATVFLMDFCNEEGRICNTITEISTGYILQTTASIPLLLTPVYKIDTNTYSYYIDAASGHVSVAR